MNEQRRILVVDDEPQITRVLRRGLITHGYDVHVAADGESALETFNDWTPDLVVTNLSMPNMDGLELCRKLRLISQLPIGLEAVRVHNYSGSLSTGSGVGQRLHQAVKT